MYFILYKDSQGLWRWNYRAANNEDICVSSESYHNKQDAIHAIGLVKTGSPTARVYDESQKLWL